MIDTVILEKIKRFPVYQYHAIPVKKIPYDPAFRALCEENKCGYYNACHMCPPCVGEIADLHREMLGYRHAVVFSTEHILDDSFDLDGMLKARIKHNRLAADLRKEIRETQKECDVLAAGGCGHCAVCALTEGLPCRAPGSAVSSMEAYGIAVNRLAEECEMEYIHPQGHLLYFGLILYS